MSVQLQMVRSRSDELSEHEAIIEASLLSFDDRGERLQVIHDNPRLYADHGYDSFKDYVEKRWPAIGIRQAQRDMAARKVLNNLRPIGRILPLTETQARPLTSLAPADQVSVWRRVVTEAGGDEVTEERVRDGVTAFRAERAAGANDDPPMATDLYFVETWNALDEDERRRIIAEAPIGSETKFNRTNDNVDWARWTWNPVTGCDHGCDYCYARDIANRYYDDLPDDRRFAPVFRPSRLHAPRHMRVPAAAESNIGERNVFVCSMADLFGKWVPQDWIDAVFAEVVGSPEWNHLFLTKFPQRLAEQRWPENAWCGTTVDVQRRVATAERSFRGVTAGIKWLSCEPMLERLTFTSLEMFDWVVIGASSRSSQTPEFQPPWEWIRHLEEQADAAGCKVYMKPNLKNIRRQEYPGAAP
jgi:protein gp37